MNEVDRLERTREWEELSAKEAAPCGVLNSKEYEYRVFRCKRSTLMPPLEPGMAIEQNGSFSKAIILLTPDPMVLKSVRVASIDGEPYWVPRCDITAIYHYGKEIWRR